MRSRHPVGLTGEVFELVLPRRGVVLREYLEEADQLANRIVIIDHGRVIAEGTPSELKRRAGRDVIEVHTGRAADLVAATRALARLGVGEPAVDAAIRRVSLSVDDGTEQLMSATRALDEEGVAVDDIALRRPTLDEVFLALTGQGLDDTTPTACGTRRAAA